MANIEEIEKYISDDILSLIFEQKENDIYKLVIDSKELEQLKRENTMTYEHFQEIIKNLPPYFKSCRENILKALEEYTNREKVLQVLNNENFYKVGFCDGIKLMLDINKQIKK